MDDEKWVIVVDDDISNLKIAGTILSENDMRVTALNSGTALLDYIREYVGWIAPVYIYENEVEQEAMCSGALRVLRGKEEPKIYTGKGMV